MSKLGGLIVAVLLLIGCSQSGSTQQEEKQMQGRKVYFNLSGNSPPVKAGMRAFS